MSAVVNFLSGEFFLKSRPNGGTAVLLRSIWVTILICLCVLPLKSYFAKNTTLAFSAEQLKIELGELIPWFGAIFHCAVASAMDYGMGKRATGDRCSTSQAV